MRQEYFSTVGVRGCHGSTESSILTSSQCERTGLLRTVANCLTAQAPHPNRGKVLLTRPSDPLPEGEGGGRSRWPGFLRYTTHSRSMPFDSVKLVHMPSGRGQGEGLDVDSSLAVIGLGDSTRSSGRFSADMVTKCIVALRRVAPVLSFHPDSSAPVPIAAKENVTFDPSPCPLPEGEGSPSLARESSNFTGCNVQTPGRRARNGAPPPSPSGSPPGEGLEFGRYE